MKSKDLPKVSTKRKTKPNHRDEIAPVAPPPPGFNTAIIEEAIATGPAGVRYAQKIALGHAEKFHEEAVDHWRKETEFLKRWANSPDSHNRARARYAFVWRPRFLAALSMTHCVQLSCRSCKISRWMAYDHRESDPEFARQWDQAIEDALELLHSRVWQRSLEGDLEPVWFMGVPVGYIRKFSDKLQIELLRAWKPDRFKTSGVASMSAQGATCSFSPRSNGANSRRSIANICSTLRHCQRPRLRMAKRPTPSFDTPRNQARLAATETETDPASSSGLMTHAMKKRDKPATGWQPVTLT
jgi:hypothetical protein